jgi:hypothetical protein
MRNVGEVVISPLEIACFSLGCDPGHQTYTSVSIYSPNPRPAVQAAGEDRMKPCISERKCKAMCRPNPTEELGRLLLSSLPPSRKRLKR